MLKIKDNVDNYKMKITTISGSCGKYYEESLERFKKELHKKGGYVETIIPISSIVIYQEKVKADLVEKVGDKE